MAELLSQDVRVHPTTTDGPDIEVLVSGRRSVAMGETFGGSLGAIIHRGRIVTRNGELV